MPYQVQLTASADKIVAKLPGDLRIRIATRLKSLGESPRAVGCIKLQGEDAYRIRVGITELFTPSKMTSSSCW